MNAAQTARLIVVGNELLTGKIEDANTPFLARSLRALGARLTRVVMVEDDAGAIAEEVRVSSAAADAVFTSGGVGPTHDDVTMRAVADAFGRPLRRHPALAETIRGHYGERTNEELLSMADLPEGARLIDAPGLWVPVICVENVFVFPGIPELFRKKFAAVAERFRGAPLLLRSLFLGCGEGDVARLLADTLEATPGVEIGSYPRIDAEADYRVMVTIEARDAEVLRAAAARIEAGLADGALLRREGFEA